jgi:CHAT domain-containing protein/tetratricopeptide (TPR) repeat protein
MKSAILLPVRRWRRAAARPPAVLAVVCLFFAACQPAGPTAVSLERAKQLSVEIVGPRSVPRSIADITSLLDQAQPDPAHAAAMRAIADAELPAGTTDLDAAAFYTRRGRAAGEIGRLQQQVADLRAALALYRERTADLGAALLALSNAENQAGDLKAALDLRQERFRLEPDGPGSIGDLVTFTALSVLMGDYPAAEKWVKESDRLLAEVINTRRRASAASLNHWHRLNSSAHGIRLLGIGRMQEAEKSLRRAVALGREVVANAADATPGAARSAAEFTAIVANDQRRLAAALAGQARLVEAEAELRDVLLLALKTYGRSSVHTALAVADLAQVLSQQGRFGEAETMARAAGGILVEAGSDATSRHLASARRLEADTLVLQGSDAAALTIYDRLDAAAKADPLRHRLGNESGPERIIALYRSERHGEALARSEALAQRRHQAFGPAALATVEAEALVGIGLAARGDREAALTRLRDAIATLTGPSQSNDENGATARSVRLRFILERYLDVLFELRNTRFADGFDPVAEGFRAADAARGRSVQRAITAASARAAARTPELAEIARREQDLEQQIAGRLAILTEAQSVPASERDESGLAALRGEVERLSSARTTLVKEIEARFPAYAALTEPRPATIDGVRAVLDPGEAMVAIFEGRKRSYVWAFGRNGAVAFAAAPITAAAMMATVADLRRATNAAGLQLGRLPEFDLGLAHATYAKLLAPVRTGWRGAATLLVVPDQASAQLPFSLLVTKPAELAPEREGQALFSNYRAVPWLAREAAIVQLPSAAAIITLRALPPADSARRPFIGFGDPWFKPADATLVTADETMTRGAPLRIRAAPTTRGLVSAPIASLPRLPDTADEVNEVGRVLHADPKQDVFLGPQADEKRVRSVKLDDRRVIMFATHGLVPGDLDGLLEPALAFSAPEIEGVEGNGLLTMDKILGLRLDADWVVLSACNTAAGDGAGAEALSGLGRAFFYAGTRSLLATNWPVETTSARAMTTEIFRRTAASPGLSRAEALRQAMLALIENPGPKDPASGRELFSYAHPLFWAAFALYGDPGREATPDTPR